MDTSEECGPLITRMSSSLPLVVYMYEDGFEGSGRGGRFVVGDDEDDDEDKVELYTRAYISAHPVERGVKEIVKSSAEFGVLIEKYLIAFAFALTN